MSSSYNAGYLRVMCYMRTSIKTIFKLLFQASSFLFLLHFFLECIAKYDPSNEIQIPGYLVDLFTVKDSPRKDYQAWINLVQNALEMESQ
jgi:hypothetical protein